MIEEVLDFLRYGRTDWYVVTQSRRLHWATPTPEELTYLGEYVAIPALVRLACGRRGRWLSLPSVLARLSIPRCRGCCRVTGMPYGIGSPRNDDRCRLALGLP